MSGELTIIKVGGKVVEEPSSLSELVNDFSTIKGYKILVHGGGRSATAMATRLGIETRMVDGRRITDQAMLEVVTMVYGGLVNKNIVTRLQALGLNALGITGADLNIIKSRERPKGDVDYGFVGDIETVNHTELTRLLINGAVPVIAPLTHDGKGRMLNTNADTIASAVAVALSPFFSVTLVYCFEKKGVLMDANNEESVIPLITPADFERLKKLGIITEGMIPKLDSGFNALEKGVSRVRITNPRGIDGSLLKGTTLAKSK